MSDQTEDRIVEQVVQEYSEGFENLAEPNPFPDRRRAFTSTGFSRLRTRWNTEEAQVISMAQQQVELELLHAFPDVYRLLTKLYDSVRTYRRDPETDQPIINPVTNLPIWEKDAFGVEVEDWSRMTNREKEDFLFQLSTRLVMWEQKAAELKAEALYAKANWEERFAAGFQNTEHIDGRRPTVDDRTQEGQTAARDSRYLAIYMTVRSNRADALIRGMQRLEQRMKDTLM